MSQIQEIADHFLSARPSPGPRRVALIAAGDAVPSSFLTACLAQRWAAEGKRVLAIEGAEAETDLGVFLQGQPLPLLEEGPEEGSVRMAGVDLFPFCLTPDRLQKLTPSVKERLNRKEKEVDFLLITLPGDAGLRLWAPVLRSFHAVVLQSPGKTADQEACFRILRFLYLTNPFVRIHMVAISHSKHAEDVGPAAGGVEVYDRLARLVKKAFRQELIGPYLWVLEQGLIHAILDRTLPKQPVPSLTALVERLVLALPTEEPLVERKNFPGLFDSLESIQRSGQTSAWDASDLFGRLEDCFPLDTGVGPMRATLLLDWERRLVVGEVAKERPGEALIRGAEAMEWVYDHLPLLGRLYGQKVDAGLPPNLALIASGYPEGFSRWVARLGLPVALYRAARGEGGLFVERVTPSRRAPLSLELSREEESALSEAIGNTAEEKNI